MYSCDIWAGHSPRRAVVCSTVTAGAVQPETGNELCRNVYCATCAGTSIHGIATCAGRGPVLSCASNRRAGAIWTVWT